MKPSSPATPPQPAPITDVAPPKPAATPEAPLAEPPKELEFTEVPEDPVAGAPTASAERAAEPQKTSEQSTSSPKPAPTVIKTPMAKSKKAAGPKKPVFAISFSVLVFVALAGVAYYAYTKTT